MSTTNLLNVSKLAGWRIAAQHYIGNDGSGRAASVCYEIRTGPHSNGHDLKIFAKWSVGFGITNTAQGNVTGTAVGFYLKERK
jgi:hypothetical protein